MGRDRNRMPSSYATFFFTILLLSLSIAVPAGAYEWFLVTDYKDIYYFINTDTVYSGGRNTTFSVMSVSKKFRKVESIKKCTINCGDKTIVVREVLRRDFFGNAERNTFEYSPKWYDILPNSAAESVERLVCCGARPRERVKEYCMDPYSQDIAKPWSHLFNNNR